MAIKVLNISSVHPWSDTRIFFRTATSIASQEDVEVTHIAVENGVEVGAVADNMEVITMPKRSIRSRYKNWRLLKKYIEEKQPDIVHFHDPELLLLARWMKEKLYPSPVCIYDMHENVPAVIGSKKIIPSIFRKRAKKMYVRFEKNLLDYVDGVVFAEEHYKQNYRWLDRRKVDVYNYPAIATDHLPAVEKADVFTFVYIGSISELRGVRVMIRLAEKLSKVRQDFNIRVIGPNATVFEEEAKAAGVSQYITFEGPKKFDEAFEVLRKSHVGLSLLLDNPNFYGCKPTKCMEYMAAGIPFLISDFLMQEDLKRYPCGLSVNMKDEDTVLKQALYLLENPEEAQKLGDVGFKAFQAEYNWQSEEQKLLSFYNKF
ncbi:glycosyltransferase [Listeria rustica]|uniref:Glycosyltransferase n=1 Tax=Listeria rustica TaxID=2713503 RepID=A0A7W1YFG6_9LIST|nr:glycosyltransferase [Listeria rustica]MBA3925606.1 glycosyltransferase [Listeria rustica]